MHALNLYFTPFAIILTVFAVYFSSLERKTAAITLFILLAGFMLNWWMSKNEYRLFRWIHKLRLLTVAINIIVTTAIFYLIGSYWAPSWLLFLIAPAGAAMFMKKGWVFSIALISALLMLGVYYFKSKYFGLPLGEVLWAMACVHALFVIIFTMFVNSMAQATVRIRDIMTGRNKG